MPDAYTLVKRREDEGAARTAEAQDDFRDDDDEGLMAFWFLLLRYPSYRYYFLAALSQNVGDWFVRVASLLAVQQMSSDDDDGTTTTSNNNNEGANLAALTIAIMIPQALFSQFGGLLADWFDRRKLMIYLNAVAGIVTLCYLLALHSKSLPLLYAVTAARSAISSMYYPVNNGMVALLVPNKRDLQLAATMNNWAWSAMALVGGVLAGAATAWIGLEACYVVDSVTYFLSAIVVVVIQGDFTVREVVRDDDGNGQQDSSSSSFVKSCIAAWDSTKELSSYLRSCGFGMLTLLKGFGGAIIWGVEDILGIGFSTVEGNNDATSYRVGVTYSVVGLGCFLGALLSTLLTDAKRPATIQAACLAGIVFQGAGWLGISTTEDSYTVFLFFTVVRTVGAGIISVNSTLLLQSLSERHMLGRMLAVEYAVYTFLEAFSATIAGTMKDAGAQQSAISLYGVGVALAMFVLWGLYHLGRCGAARVRFNTPTAVIAAIETSPNTQMAVSSDEETEFNEYSDVLRESDTTQSLT